MLGEFRTVTGKETVHTQNIWKIQKPRNLKNLSRISSKRSSFPVLRMRKRRKPESRAPQSMMKRDVTIWRAWCSPENDKLETHFSRVPSRLHCRARGANVIIASTTKLVPPAKSNTKNQHRLIEIHGNQKKRHRSAYRT